ncbi:GH25 family lysozyme [Subtercola vilae]|uniref:Uncharacterized protein n=1 Tax=Subtercola vilae TaxID=2056433 RepID=A0A4T2BT97_9MICO|nr:GH25 family lysozyme [Subtercola vilae]TIH33671.1 hypothetical protein D4765_14405 [Subtercola vilae]
MVAIDISYAQGFPNFDGLADDISLVIARAGTLEGGGMLQDSKLIYNRENCRRVGRQFGTYLFNGPVNPTVAAKWYLSIIDWKPGDVTAIDVESPNAWGPAEVLEFNSFVRGEIGQTPWTYGSTSLLFQPQWKAVSDDGSLLWGANYGANTGTPGSDPGNGPWATRILWQYTSVAQHAGLSGSVDTNMVNDAALAQHLNLTPKPGDEDMPLNQTDLDSITSIVREQVTGAMLDLVKVAPVGQRPEFFQYLQEAAWSALNYTFLSAYSKGADGQPLPVTIKDLTDATHAKP